MTPRPAKEPRDRRVRKTRKHLRDALVGLILERGWDAVSVVDVCERADVGRSTFYVHFIDKEDLLLSGFEDLHASLGELREADAGTFGFVEPLVQHARDNVKLFRAMVGRRSGQNVQRKFRDVVTRLVAAELGSLDVPEERRAFVSRYVSGGFVELLLHWLDHPARVEPAALAATFRELTMGAVGRRAR